MKPETLFQARRPAAFAISPARGAAIAVAALALVLALYEWRGILFPADSSVPGIAVVGEEVRGPDGIVFGKIKGPGMYNVGETTIADFFARDANAFPGVSLSLQRVMQSVSRNEGNLEAINTYDNSFLSVGVFQWTAGAGSNPGELAGLLELLKSRAPKTFAVHFGAPGLDVRMAPPIPGDVRRGFLTLNGQKLDTPERKAKMRQPNWAWRFWRATQDVDVRRAQIELAMSRIGVFYQFPIPGRSFVIADYVKSEYGVALLLDQHVNRPAHVPETLLQAVDLFVEATQKGDPALWSTQDETIVLAIYLSFRTATNMTDSQRRAERTLEAVKAGILSDRRGSFVL